MQVLHRCCAGLDINKDTVVACARRVSRIFRTDGLGRYFLKLS